MSQADIVDPRGQQQVRMAFFQRVKKEARLPLPVVLYLLTVVTPVLFHVGPLLLSGLRVFLLLMVIPLSINLLRGKFGRLLATDYLFFLYILWSIVALAKNNPDQVVENVGAAIVEFLGGYLVGRAYVRTKEDFVALARVLLVIVVALLPFALYETMTGRPPIIETIRKLPSVTSVSIVNIEARMGLERVQAVFAHPIHYGLFSSAAFSLVFVGLRNILSGPVRWAGSAAVGLSVFLSLSSGALLPIILQTFMIVWAFVFQKLKARWILLLGLMALAYVVVDLLSNRTPIKVFMSYATFSAHTAYWRSIIFEWGMVNVWANPIFGIGLNDWVRPSFMKSGSMDNFWLVTAVRYGIPGFLLLAAGYAVAVFRIGFRDFDSDPILWQTRRAWMFTFIGLSLTLTTVHIWTSIYSFVFFLFGAGMWFITVQVDEDEGSEQLAQESGRETAYRRAGPRREVVAASSATADGETSARSDEGSQELREVPRYSRFRTDPVPRDRGGEDET